MAKKVSDADLINSFGAARKALKERLEWLVAAAEEAEEEGEMARLDAEERAEEFKRRAGQIELFLSEALDD